MKKICLLWLFILIVSNSALAATENPSRGFISVGTEAVDEIAPNMVKISFAIEVNNQDAKIAAQENKASSQNVINSVKELLGKDETIKTLSYTLNPQYANKDGSRKLTGYFASNTLQVSLYDIDKVGKIISTALENGATSVNGLEYLIEDTDGACNILIQKAASSAKERANKTAQSLNTSVAGIKSINARCSASRSQFSNFKMISAKASAQGTRDESSQLPFEAGKTELRAFVNADFYVK